jgi:hypothetical protein
MLSGKAIHFILSERQFESGPHIESAESTKHTTRKKDMNLEICSQSALIAKERFVEATHH